MGKDLIRYEELHDRAMRGLVREVLAGTARDGLPGEHHFYLTFAVNAPGVDIPASLRERFSDEMTIVLQHQFSDLTVDDTRFMVTLSFGGQPCRLNIPLNALRAFLDPAASFAIQFRNDGDSETDMPDGPPPKSDDIEEAAGAEVVTLDRFRNK